VSVEAPRFVLQSAENPGSHYDREPTCSSKTVLQRFYHDLKHPSHLLLPIIPQ
jgi:hypothetical protein